MWTIKENAPVYIINPIYMSGHWCYNNAKYGYRSDNNQLFILCPDKMQTTLSLTFKRFLLATLKSVIYPKSRTSL